MKKGWLVGLLLAASFSIYASETTLTVFHTGDTHGRGMSDEGVGYGKMSAWVKAQRNNSPNALFLDVGDAVSGMPIVDLSEGEANILAMNRMGYDAFTPGNADFIFGSRIVSLAKKANFPFISANIWYQDKLAFQPFMMKNVAGLNIGIIGVSPLNAMVATTEEKLAGFRVSDPIHAVQAAVAQLRDKADLIIVLAHLGKTDPQMNITRLAAAVPEIDVLIDGHDHIALKVGQQQGQTVIVNAGQYGENLGQLTLTLKDKKIVAWREQLLDSAELSQMKADDDVQRFIEQQKAKSEAMLSRIVMTLPFTLEGKREQVRSGQTSLGSVLADAEREWAKADIAFTVGAFLRDSISAGPVSYGQVRNALPFTLPLVTREMSGQQIRDFLEHNYSGRNLISGAYAHVSGITYTVDFSRPVGERMVNIRVNGEPMAMDKTWRVACNEQVSDYGIRDIAIQQRFAVTMSELLIDYLRRHPALEKPAPRVRFARN